MQALESRPKTQCAETPRPSGGGLFAYLITPYDAQEQIDLRTLHVMAEQVQAAGVQGLTCLASTTEGPYLSDAERRSVVETLSRSLQPGMGFNVGVSAASTQHTIERALHARDHGASCLMVEMQQYFPIERGNIVEHYAQIAERVGLPIRAYNLPGPGRPDLDPSLIAQLTAVPGIASVKDASGEVDRITQIRALSGKHVVIHCGLHFQLLDGMRLGAQGWEVALHPHFAKDLIDLYHQVEADPWGETSTRAFLKWLPLFRLMRQVGVPQSIKAISSLTPLPLGQVRAPQRRLDAQQTQAVQAAYRAAKGL